MDDFLDGLRRAFGRLGDREEEKVYIGTATAFQTWSLKAIQSVHVWLEEKVQAAIWRSICKSLKVDPNNNYTVDIEKRAVYEVREKKETKGKVLNLVKDEASKDD